MKPVWRQRAILALAVASSSACANDASAQQSPIPSPEDSRIANLQYTPGGLAQLRAIAGTELAVLVPRGEHVQRVTVGDPDAVRIIVPGDQDGLVVSALRPLNDVSLSVETDQQVYRFNLSVTYQGTAPWLVKVQRGGNNTQFPSIFRASIAPLPTPLPPGEWKVKGDKALEPSMIRDDGLKVSIQWSSSQAIPAVFARDERGQEQMVNGYMRGDAFVIDRVFEHLVFRIDKATADADRVAPKPRK